MKLISRAKIIWCSRFWVEILIISKVNPLNELYFLSDKYIHQLNYYLLNMRTGINLQNKNIIKLVNYLLKMTDKIINITQKLNEKKAN